MIILNAIITYAFVDDFLPSFLRLSLSPSVVVFYKCRSMLSSEYYKNTFFIAMKIKPYTRYYVTWCVSLFPISFLCFRFIYPHAFFTILYFLFGIFHFLTSLCSFFISCNIFLICFLLLSYEFLFLYFYVYFCKFYEWKNCFLSFSVFTTYRRRDAKRLLTDKTLQNYFLRTYIEILFSLPFLCVFFFPIFMLSFNLPFSSSSTFSLIF